MNVHVYIIQQPPAQRQVVNVYQLYKRLLDMNNLSDFSLLENSLTRSEYAKQQVGVEKVFAKFKNRRGVKFIYKEDLVCDEKFCPIGTGEMPYYADYLHLSQVKARQLKARIVDSL
jgi:hypothetical protein